jgi:hypothetical protein
VPRPGGPDAVAAVVESPAGTAPESGSFR